MTFSELCVNIFSSCTKHYHEFDSVDAVPVNPYSHLSIEYRLFQKNWIDSVQWHLEDIIRDPNIDPNNALAIKRRIDFSNQERTDLVEMIDSYFLEKYRDVAPKPDAYINTESPAWAIDRLSILILKIFHMEQEIHRSSASDEHKSACNRKLSILLEQKKDLTKAIDQLLNKIELGQVYMKVYRQMKMYNDPALNPILYGKK